MSFGQTPINLGYEAAGIPEQQPVAEYHGVETQYIDPRSQYRNNLANSTYANSRSRGSQYGHQYDPNQHQLNYSRIEDHNSYYHTDKLYDPLRSTLIHPESALSHANQIPQTVRHSYLTHDYKVLNPQEANQIRNNVMIPMDVDLAQTDHFYKVQDKEFVAVNAEQRVIGKSISPLELERIKQQGIRKSAVVYDLKERVEEVDPVTTYSPPPLEDYKAKTYKYNLYSIIDEPMNWVREHGCKGARWCAPNEIVASRNEPQSLRWLK